MYFSLGQAAKEAGVAKSTISKALASGKLSYAAKGPDGYKIDPAELFRVFPPNRSKPGSDEPPSNNRQPDSDPPETGAYPARLEARIEGLTALIAEKERRIADLEADREQLREDRNRVAQNYQDERDRLLKLIEDQTATVKLLTDERAGSRKPASPSLWERLIRGTRKHIAAQGEAGGAVASQV